MTHDVLTHTATSTVSVCSIELPVSVHISTSPINSPCHESLLCVRLQRDKLKCEHICCFKFASSRQVFPIPQSNVLPCRRQSRQTTLCLHTSNYVVTHTLTLLFFHRLAALQELRSTGREAELCDRGDGRLRPGVKGSSKRPTKAISY